MLADDEGGAGVALGDQPVEACGKNIHVPVHFGHDHHFRTGGHSRLHGDVTRVAAHDLHHGGAVVAAAGGSNGAHGLHTYIDGGIIAQRGLGIAQVVVDGAGNTHAGDAQLAQVHGAVEAAVAADDHQRIDANLAQIVGTLALHFGFFEFIAACGTQKSTALVRNIQDCFQVQSGDVVLGIFTEAQQAIIAALDAHKLNIVRSCAAGHADYSRIHAGAVAAAGQNADLSDQTNHSLISLGQVETPPSSSIAQLLPGARGQKGL